MMKIFQYFLLIINIVSFVFVLIFGVFGLVEYFLGPAGVEKFLKKLKIPLSYSQVLFIGFLCLAVMIISYIVRKKLTGQL